MSSQKTYLDEWQQCAQRELGERPLDELYAPSLEGILIKPLYTAADLPESMPPPPGLYPSRGIRATMYANKRWTIRQYAGFSSAKASNAFYRDCLKRGKRAYRSPSICPPIEAMIPMTLSLWEMLVKRALPSIRYWICTRFFRA